MDQLCGRCTRQALQASHRIRQRSLLIHSRQLSQSSTRLAGPIDLSQPIGTKSSGSEKSRTPTRPSNVLTRTQKPAASPPRVLQRKPGAGSSSTSDLVFRSLDLSGNNDAPPVLTRSGPPRSDRSTSLPPRGGSPGVLIRKHAGPTRPDQPQNPLNRPVRTGFGRPGTPSQAPSRAPSRGPRVNRILGGGDGRGGGYRGGSGRGRGPNTAGLTDEEAAQARSIGADMANAKREEARAQRYEIKNLYGHQEAERYNAARNGGLPVEDIPYVPADQTMEELRKDWPGTPLSSAGMVASIEHKLNFLARDLPHDYWTPRQIAERFVAGGLVKFENEEHKAKVMGFAAEVMRENAAKSKTNTDAATEAGFVSVQPEQNSGTQPVIDAMIKGAYPELEKGQRPLFASITRQLRNNETYGAGDRGKFMGRVEQLIQSIQKQVAAQKAAEVAKTPA